MIRRRSFLRRRLITLTSKAIPVSSKGGRGAGQDVADGGGDGESQHPGPDDAFDQTPFDSAKTFHRAHPHDGGRDDVGGGKRDTVIAGYLNDDRGGRLGGESVDRLQLHHFVAERANDAPAARGCARGHRRRAQEDDPRRHLELRRDQELKSRRKMREGAAARAGEKGERDDAHGFLRVVRPVAVRHPGRAHELELAKNSVDEVRSKTMQHHNQHEHEQRADDEAKDR